MIKYYCLFINFVFFIANAYSQFPVDISKDDSLRIVQKVKSEIVQYRRQLLSNEKSEVDIVFIVDTFKIERMFEEFLAVNNSTLGMIDGTRWAEMQYDQLLNKYFKIILNRLVDKDKDVLRNTQKNWIAYRDSEFALNRLLVDEKYSGGGTIQGIIFQYRMYEITKIRVCELYEYIRR